MVKYKVGNIVREYLMEIGDGQFSRFKRFYQFAVSGVREWNMDITALPQTALLPINDNDTVDMPDNMLNWTFIGLVGADGRIYPLGERKNISLQKQYSACGDASPYRPSSLAPDNFATNLIGVSPNIFADHFRNGQLMGKYFGIGGGNNGNGYFRIDKEGNQIVLNGVNIHLESLYMEYISDITAVNQDYDIHPFMLETLKAWMYWKSIQRDRNFSLGEKQIAKQDYNSAYRWSMKRFNSTPLSTWYEAIRFGNKAAVKF